VTDYPNQSRPQDGWPAQPPRAAGGAYGRDAYGGREPSSQDAYGGQGPSSQDAYGGREPYGQGDYSPAAPRRRRRGRRAWTVLIVLVLVLAGVFVAADRIAVAYAQNTIASEIQTQANLSARPSVTIEGFPFLTQVLARDVKQIDISASNVRESNITISSITATATGVHINSSFKGATIDQINGTALITYANLESALPSPLNGATITPDPSAGPNGVNVSLGGGLATATGQVMLTSPTQVTLKIDNLGGLASFFSGGLSQTTYPFNIPTLPVGLKVTSVNVTNQGVALTATAHDTTLSQ
jgi:hypothetical protein